MAAAWDDDFDGAREGGPVAKATLLVIQGVDQGTRFELGEEPAGLGRGVRNDIRILDTEVSRQHATFEFLDGGFHVTDRHSSNGTFVNGVAIRTRRLKSGDQVQAGRSVLLFEQPQEAEPLASAADRIDLLERDQGDGDRSSIVGAVDQHSGHDLLEKDRVPAATAAQTVTSLQALYRVTEAVVSPSVSLDQLLQRILTLTIDVVGADRGCVLLSEPGSEGEVTPHVFSHRRRKDTGGRMPVSRSIVDYVLEHGQGVRTSDAQHDRRFEPGQSIVQAGIREAMCVPMQGRYALMGVIYVDTTTPPGRAVVETEHADRFGDEQLRLLVAIGRQAALAIENSHYQQALLKAERLAAVGQTIAMLSHHIKNILQGVRGGSYLIDMGLKDHSEELIARGWNIVEKNQNRIYNLVMDMLTFSKERKPDLQPGSLNVTVREVAELMEARAMEGGVLLECSLDEAVPETSFDADGIHRAVLNIVTNALDAVEGGQGAAVRIETGYNPPADSVFVAVSDN
ncbi:MAG: FHA domain-containing protein, partial [Planctomycetes bacterium]|nr:FHA domain-containing protein [Planctomycetota bacterium]